MCKWVSNRIVPIAARRARCAQLVPLVFSVSSVSLKHLASILERSTPQLTLSPWAAMSALLLLNAALMGTAIASAQGVVSQNQALHSNTRGSQSSSQSISEPTFVRTSATIEAAPTWLKLSPAQQIALKPMQADWAQLDSNRKKKWLAVAQRYQTMSAADQARMHQRMGEWAKLSPAQRSAARDNYSAVLSSPSSSSTDPAAKGNLNDQWIKYQALSPEKKASLAEQSNAQDKGKTRPLSAP